MSAIIIMDGYRLKLETGDEVEIERNECGRCETTHTKLTVTRDGKEIVHLGDGYYLYGEDEIYGGVAVDENDIPFPEYRWVTHIIPAHGFAGMTEDKMYYVGLCGEVLNHSPTNKHDKITFAQSELTTVAERERICPKCWEIYDRKKNSTRQVV